MPRGQDVRGGMVLGGVGGKHGPASVARQHHRSCGRPCAPCGQRRSRLSHRARIAFAPGPGLGCDQALHHRDACVHRQTDHQEGRHLQARRQGYGRRKAHVQELEALCGQVAWRGQGQGTQDRQGGGHHHGHQGKGQDDQEGHRDRRGCQQVQGGQVDSSQGCQTDDCRWGNDCHQDDLQPLGGFQQESHLYVGKCQSCDRRRAGQGQGREGRYRQDPCDQRGQRQGDQARGGDCQGRQSGVRTKSWTGFRSRGESA